MKIYMRFGFKDFYVALGYKGNMIKGHFLDRQRLSGNISIDMMNGRVKKERKPSEDWLVQLIDTGHDTHTGGRVKRLEAYLKAETFMVTYGDGVADINLKELLRFHKAHGKLVTITAVRPPARFGGIVFEGDLVADFTEKPQIGEGWINGGFLVLEPAVFQYLDGDQSSLEANALERLSADRQLAAYRHEGFWQCMDTLRDKNFLNSLWKEGRAPWKVWE